MVGRALEKRLYRSTPDAGSRMRSRQLGQRGHRRGMVQSGQRVDGFFLHGGIPIVGRKSLEQRHECVGWLGVAQRLDRLALDLGLRMRPCQLEQEGRAPAVAHVAERLHRFALDLEIGVLTGDRLKGVKGEWLRSCAQRFDRLAARVVVWELARERDERRRGVGHRGDRPWPPPPPAGRAGPGRRARCDRGR